MKPSLDSTLYFFKGASAGRFSGAPSSSRNLDICSGQVTTFSFSSKNPVAKSAYACVQILSNAYTLLFALAIKICLSSKSKSNNSPFFRDFSSHTLTHFDKIDPTSRYSLSVFVVFLKDILNFPVSTFFNFKNLFHCFICFKHKWLSIPFIFNQIVYPCSYPRPHFS